jgi:7,8-dihydropterin-6-yl-methyl-4-(beta-D-ribofuranosyl)aminobenzene 5'-phosphate synthase
VHLHGFELDIVEEGHPSFLFDRSILITGEVPRTTGYEPGFPPQQAWLSGRWEPDPLVLADQALIVDIKDKGLLIMTGCGHAGIINICRYAQRLSRQRPISAVMGGFHLNGPHLRTTYSPGPRRPGGASTIDHRPCPLHRMACLTRHARTAP